MNATTRKGLGRRLSWLVVLGLMSTAVFLPSASPALAGDKTEITICHATGADNNPYVVNSPAINSSGAFAGELSGGHNDHTGPIWFPGITVAWGDIIPPYEYAPANFSYPGLNWTAEGQAIYNNGCAIPEPTATPTPAPTATPTPAGGVGGATATPAPTATPKPTLPSTDAIDGTGSGSSGDGWRIILLAMAGVLAAALMLTPAGAVVRKDDATR
jgi:hypothetical protein